MTAIDFIGKLVNHIHLKRFRVVRRYGLYSRKKHKLSIEIIKLYNFIKQRDINEIINTVKNRNKSFRDRLIETFGVNSFICSKCGQEMILWEIWMPKYGKIYNVLDKLVSTKSSQLHKDTFIHSEQGVNYTSPKFQNLLKKNKLGQSMSRRGNC